MAEVHPVLYELRAAVNKIIQDFTDAKMRSLFDELIRINKYVGQDISVIFMNHLDELPEAFSYQVFGLLVEDSDRLDALANSALKSPSQFSQLVDLAFIGLQLTITTSPTFNGKIHSLLSNMKSVYEYINFLFRFNSSPALSWRKIR